jgi:uncharacterized membrane protein
MTLLALGVASASSRYLSGNPEVFFPEQRDVYVAHFGTLMLHVVGGSAALVLGPWQFWGGLRRRRLGLHRWLGRLYLVAVLVGGLGGLAIARVAFGGLPARLGFGLLAIVWLGCGAAAYRAIRRRDVASHQEWMIRSYALTLAAVTLRIWNPLLALAGFSFPEAYVSVAWLCWVPNLLIAELYILHRRPRPAIAGGLGDLDRADEGSL